MRLYLHGRLSTAALLKRIANASQHGTEFHADRNHHHRNHSQNRQQDDGDDDESEDGDTIITNNKDCGNIDIDGIDDLCEDNASIVSEASNSIVSTTNSTSNNSILCTSSVSSSSSSSSSLSSSGASDAPAAAPPPAPEATTITSLRLSNWDFDKIDDVVIRALQNYMEHEASRETSSSLQEVMLHNCTGGERLQYFVVVVFQTTASLEGSSLTIRYDKQRKMPSSIANGLYQGATEHGSAAPSHGGVRSDSSGSSRACRLRALTLKGMTLTPLTVRMLQVALPRLRPYLTELTVRGNFPLVELDRNQVSVVGRYTPDMKHVVMALHDILKRLSSCLQVVDLQQCHLPDEYLAVLLEAIEPTQILELRLNGNMAQEESLHMLHEILTDRGCSLRHLDLSWQRLSQASRNCSVLPISELDMAVGTRNSSLETLNLSDNRLLDEDVARLALALPKHTSLHTVMLQNCRITDRGMLALAVVLPQLGSQMKRLHVDGSQAIKQVALVRRKLFQSLLKNLFLHDLALPSSCQSKAMDWVLEFNRAGRRVLLDDRAKSKDDKRVKISGTTSASTYKPIPDNLWPAVLERADRISRQDYLMDEGSSSSNQKSASTIYLLFREKGYQSLLSEPNVTEHQVATSHIHCKTFSVTPAA